MSPFTRRALVTVTLLGLLGFAWGGGESRAAEPRFTALWADGQLTTGDDVAGWNSPHSQPTFNGRPLLDAKTPLRWLRDNWLRMPEPPAAFVEFCGGDRLPGEVVAWQSEVTSTERFAPAHLVVRPGAVLDMPQHKPRAALRVTTQWLRRVVWESNRLPYQPATVHYRDGRSLSFRSLRWGSGAVVVLTEQGIVSVPFAEIAEVHLPQQDSWDAYFRQLAVLAPSCDSRLVQCETALGLRATTSLARLEAHAARGAREPAGWYHMLQPAWSLDALYVPHRQVQQRNFFAPHEVPLSAIEPLRSTKEAVYSASWSRAEVDRNVQGGALKSGSRFWGWGLGVHAPHELEFEVPPYAQSFQASFGLDRLAGAGGCVRGRVWVSEAATRRELFATGLLVGSKKTESTGNVKLGGSTASGSEQSRSLRLILLADAALGESPQGADPDDIRDIADWLEPLITLDARAVEGEVGRRAPRAHPALGEWHIEGQHGTAYRLANQSHIDAQSGAGFRLVLLPLVSPLKLSREIEVDVDRPNLALALARIQPNAKALRVEVRADGRTILNAEAPRPTGATVTPLVASLAEYAGRSVRVEILLHAADTQTWVDWRSAVMVK